MGTAVQTPLPPTPLRELPSSEEEAGLRLYARIEKLAIPIGVCFTLIAFVRFAISNSRRLWFDEIYTAAVSAQPTWTEAWKAYTAPVDLQSLLFYFVSRVSWLLLGRNELALRMPEILGVIVFSWCMFFFVGKRLGRVFGLSAMVLPLVTNLALRDCAGQARPYGMLLAACGLAMLAWRYAVESPKRAASLPLFAGSMALVVACHAYAVVVVLVFALAELFRTVQTRRIDWPLWLCFPAALPPLIPYWLTLQAVKMSNGVIGPAKWSHWSNIPGFYQYFLGRERVLILAGQLFVCLILLRKGPKPRTAGMPMHEIVLTAILAASPAFSVTLAMLVTKYYMARYSIFAIGGVIILAILVFDAVATSRRIASLMLLLISLILFGMDYQAFSLSGVRERDASLQVPFAQVPAGTPLVIASGLALLPTDMYASDADLANTYYLIDHAADIEYTGSTIFDFQPPFTDYYHFRIHLQDYTTFTRAHKTFWVYGPYGWGDDWQIKKLRDDGASVVEKGKYNGEGVDNYLLEVTLP